MDTLHEQELAKYQKIWKRAEYRQWSPGEAAVPTFIANLPWEKGDTVIDLGCGTGRAGASLADRGLSVTLLDFCADALEVASLPFITANIWRLPRELQCDWIFCVDVMEHIPEEKVKDSIRGMAGMAKRGGFLQIALFEDGCGSLIGEKLHMTVKPMAWWLVQISSYFDVIVIGDDKDARGNNGYAKFAIRSR